MTGWPLEGTVARQRGDLDAAERVFTQALAISARLAELDPTNTGGQRNLSRHIPGPGMWRGTGATWRRRNGRSSRLWRSGRGYWSWTPPTPGGDVTWRWRTPGSAVWRRNGGDLDGAERAFTQALAIFRRLARLDPTNAAWQRDLASARIKLYAVRSNPPGP